MILHGQTHGGIAQGVGQALLEDTHYDPASGQLLTASFMDYAMPRADNLPWLETEMSEIPSPTNRLGVRSAGEGGTTPALAVVINAVVDALAELGISHIELPATPERVWRAIQAAGQNNLEKVLLQRLSSNSRLARISCGRSHALNTLAGRALVRHGVGIAISVWYDEPQPNRELSQGGLAN